MPEISEKELKVLRVLLKDSSQLGKILAAEVGVSPPEFSKTIRSLQDSKILSRYTIDVDYTKLGFVSNAFYLFKLKDRKDMNKVVEQLQIMDGVIEIQEVFGPECDLIVRIMAKDNDRISEVTQSIANIQEVNSDAHSFTLIVARNHRRERGVAL